MSPLYEKYGPKVQPQQPPVNLQNVFSRARQIMQSVQDPRLFVMNSFGNIPAEIQNDPDQILQYLMQNNRLSPQQLQMLQMLGR